MEYVISTFAQELSDGGGGLPTRQTLSEGPELFAHLAAVLRASAAWSPIVWKDDIRRSATFEAESIAVVDWEVTHEQPFPHALYQDVDRLRDFIASLRAGDTALPDVAHLTEHGLRLIWFLDRTVTDALEYLELTQRLVLDYQGDLAAAHLAAGFTCARHLQQHLLVEVANDVKG